MLGLVAGRFGWPWYDAQIRTLGLGVAVVALAFFGFGWQLAVPLAAAGLFVAVIALLRTKMERSRGSKGGTGPSEP